MVEIKLFIASCKVPTQNALDDLIAKFDATLVYYF